MVTNKQEILVTGAKDSEMNILSLKRAEVQEREQRPSLHHYRLSPLDMDIFMGDKHKFLKTTWRNLPRPRLFPWVHLASRFLEFGIGEFPSSCPAVIIPLVLEALEVFNLPAVTLLVRYQALAPTFLFIFLTVLMKYNSYIT